MFLVCIYGSCEPIKTDFGSLIILKSLFKAAAQQGVADELHTNKHSITALHSVSACEVFTTVLLLIRKVKLDEK